MRKISGKGGTWALNENLIFLKVHMTDSGCKYFWFC